MKNHWIKNCFAILLATFSASALADDIDLFVGAEPGAVDAPNVLIILDNTANWNTAFTNEMAALASVVESLPADKVKLGLMLFTETGGGNSGNDGAYVRAAIRLMSESNKLKYKSLVTSLDIGGDKGNAGKISKAMEEAYFYFNKGAPYAGNQKAKTDYAGNTTGSAASKAIYALAGNALKSKDDTVYASPTTTGCVKNYIIYISNGPAQDNNADIKQATDALSALKGVTTTIPISPSGSQDNVADEWARFMFNSPLAITTYTIDVNAGLTGQGPGWSALLDSIANVGGGDNYDVTSSGTQIADAINSALSEIQSENSVFASVSLPANSNIQGKLSNQVYVGMFRPDAQSRPKWYGNLKQYKLGFVNDQLELLDAGDDIATDAATGYFAACARSFWTPLVADNYWFFQKKGSCGIADSNQSNFPDGEIVEKGGQAYTLRQIKPDDRKMKTCATNDCSSDLVDFDTDNVSADRLDLPAASTYLGGVFERNTLAAKIVSWQRGVDVQDENGNLNLLEMRPSVHGDIVHSRPLAINYANNDEDPQVVVYYGGNDGVLRAINGNQTANIDTVSAGSEMWSFVPPEFLPKIKRVYDNTPKISYPGSTTGTPKDYGVDGFITDFRSDNGTWIFSTLRRGGRAVYAFDVTDYKNLPTLKWRVGCDDKDCTDGFEELGQTWSAPKVMRAGGFRSGLEPLIIMGGGYDTCHDADPNNACNASSKGRRIYVMDADTGDLEKTFETESSVIGDVIVVPDSTGLAKFAYAADLGGNVYRISGPTATDEAGATYSTEIGTSAPGTWTITKIAAFGGSGASNRKFMFGPDVIEKNGTYVLLLGSGDREKPLKQYTEAAAVENRFYMFTDKPASTTWLTEKSSQCGAALICEALLWPITDGSTPTSAQLATKKGWYLALEATEQVVTSAITVFNTVFFNTHTPTPPETNQCSALGTAKPYAVNYTNAAGVGSDPGIRFSTAVGGGLMSNPVVGRVTLDNGEEVVVCFSCKDTKGGSVSAGGGGGTVSPNEVGEPSTLIRPKSRVFWKIKK